MSSSLYRDLCWLPRAPEQFAARSRELLASSEPIGRALKTLASHALDENQLTRLARVIESHRTVEGGLDPLAPFRLGIVSNATTEFLVAPLVGTAARHGIALECTQAPYGQAIQSALNPKSAIYLSRPDAILVALDYRGLPLSAVPGNAQAAMAACRAAIDQINTIRGAVREHSRVPCIVQTIARPVEAIFGSLDLAMPGTERSLIDAYNRMLAESIGGTEDLLLDVAALAETVGLADWHDPGLWNLGKIPFSNTYLPLYADFICRLIGSLRGKSRRCLILDLDNTLWGGVIGDDGLEGIVLGQGDPTGEAFLSVQRSALALRGRGIVLAVSSKNQDATARLPFQEHPEMLLRENHLAVFQANWKDKATNIKAIAEELSLGLDSMVFLDDNPVERGLVRELLPDVAVPELPDDASLYARTLLASGYFEAISFSAEDRQRAEFYQDNARRLALQRDAGDVRGYLRSLQMTIHFARFDSLGRSRIAQLINKSNQFNLTTRRYTELEVTEIEADPRFFTLQVRLRDVFGDNGMISVLICRSVEQVWQIDTWLMSCRVLGRGVESAVLNELAAAAKASGAKQLMGQYLPTARNQLVEDHYAKLGFTLVERRGDGATEWKLDIATYQPAEVEMQIERDETLASTV